MKLKVAQARLQYLISKRNGYLVLALGSILTNIILTITLVCFFFSQKIILVPPEIERPLWVSSTKVSKEYLSSISLYLLNLILNTNADNVDIQHRLLLKQISPQNYQQVKTNLHIQAEKIKDEHLDSNFSLRNVVVDNNNLIARVSGYLQYRVGEETLPKKFITYQMKYRFKTGSLKLVSFEEINK